MTKKKGFIDKVEAEVVSAVKSYAGDKVKKKLIKIGEVSALVVLAMFLVSFGLAELLGTYFSVLSNGLNFVILGTVFLIVGLLISY